MADHVRAAGKNLRPHAKTHRCPEIARRQVAAGALGVACAKLGEAEVMARAGIRGLLITTEVVAPAAIRRLMRLAGEAPDTMVVVDHPAQRRATWPRGRRGRRHAQRAGRRRRRHPPHRASRPASPRWRSAGWWPRSAALRLRGLQGYAGPLRARHGLGGAARGVARGAWRR